MTPIVSIFHHPKNPTSRAALDLLQQRRNETPRNPPFDLEVNESRAPTPEQLETISSYMKTGKKNWLQDGVEPIGDLRELVKEVQKNPDIFRFPIVVNWEGARSRLLFSK